jgi:hypothetical protein
VRPPLATPPPPQIRLRPQTQQPLMRAPLLTQRATQSKLLVATSVIYETQTSSGPPQMLMSHRKYSSPADCHSLIPFTLAPTQPTKLRPLMIPQREPFSLPCALTAFKPNFSTDSADQSTATDDPTT